jgi:hypothetical protein
VTEPVGPLAEEAARLLEALQAWVRTAAGRGLDTDQVATGSAECRLCPFCALLSLLRSSRPETFEHLLDASGSLLAAVRSAIETHEQQWADRTRTVQHIDVTEPAETGEPWA